MDEEKKELTKEEAIKILQKEEEEEIKLFKKDLDAILQKHGYSLEVSHQINFKKIRQ